MLEEDELKAIASNIDGDLESLCRKLGFGTHYLEEWKGMSSEKYTPAYRLLFLWFQREDTVSFFTDLDDRNSVRLLREIDFQHD